MGFLNLVLDIIVSIFKKITLKDLYKISSINKYIYQICQNDQLWEFFFIKRFPVEYDNIKKKLRKEFPLWLISKSCPENNHNPICKHQNFKLGYWKEYYKFLLKPLHLFEKIIIDDDIILLQSLLSYYNITTKGIKQPYHPHFTQYYEIHIYDIFKLAVELGSVKVLTLIIEMYPFFKDFIYPHYDYDKMIKLPNIRELVEWMRTNKKRIYLDNLLWRAAGNNDFELVVWIVKKLKMSPDKYNDYDTYMSIWTYVHKIVKNDNAKIYEWLRIRGYLQYHILGMSDDMMERRMVNLAIENKSIQMKKYFESIGYSCLE